MLTINTGFTILNAMTQQGNAACDKDEVTLCREAASRGRWQALLSALSPAVMLRRIRQRAMQSELDKAIARLAETSPHLLNDIGILDGIDIEDGATDGAKIAVEVARPDPRVPAGRPVIRVLPVDAPVRSAVPAVAHA